MKSTLFSFSALVLLAAANPSGCVHAPEATTTETSSAVAEAAAADSTSAPEVAATADEGPGDPAIDKLIDAYEEYVDENLKLMQRTLDGDMAAMTDMAAIVEKSQKIHNSLLAPGVQQRMSKAQESRLDALEAKYERVAQQIEQRGIRIPLILTEEQAERTAERAERNAQHTEQAMQGVEQQMQEMEKGMQGMEDAGGEE